LGPLVNFWQRGLNQGFKAFFASTSFQAIGYFCTALCLAEMLSALPFTGGTYGIVRGILGPYMGFLAGVLEALALIGTCTELLSSMGLAVVSTLGIHSGYQILIWLGILLVSLRIQVFHHRNRMFTFFVAAVLAIIFCCIYVAVSLRHMNAKEYYKKESRNEYLHHFSEFVDIFPYPTVLYGGLQWMPMIAKGTDHVSFPFVSSRSATVSGFKSPLLVDSKRHRVGYLVLWSLYRSHLHHCRYRRKFTRSWTSSHFNERAPTQLRICTWFPSESGSRRHVECPVTGRIISHHYSMLVGQPGLYE
jgi:hypothetical protein